MGKKQIIEVFEIDTTGMAITAPEIALVKKGAIDKTKVLQIMMAHSTLLKRIVYWRDAAKSVVVKSIEDHDTIDFADAAWKDLQQTRLAFVKEIDGEMAQSKITYEAMQQVRDYVVKEWSAPAEAHLKEQKNYAETIRQKHIATFHAERLAILSKEFGISATNLKLGEMTAQEWEISYEIHKRDYFKEKEEAERKANEAKLAEEARDKELAEAKAKAEEAKAKAEEAERQTKELQAELDAERKQRESLEYEAKCKESERIAKEQAEAKAKADEAENLRFANDAEKLRVWAKQLLPIIGNAPTLNDKDSAKILQYAVNKLTDIHVYFTK